MAFPPCPSPSFHKHIDTYIHFISSGDNMSDILNEPACIPRIPPLNKEAAKSKPDMPQDLQDFPLLSVYLYVTERDLGLLGRLQP